MVLRDAAAAHSQQHAGPAGTDKDSRAALPAPRRRRECCLPKTPPTSSSSKSSNTPLLQSVPRSRRRSGEIEPVMFSLAGERMMSSEEYSALPRSIQYVSSPYPSETQRPALDRHVHICVFAPCLIINTNVRPHVIRAREPEIGHHHMHAKLKPHQSKLPLQ